MEVYNIALIIMWASSLMVFLLSTLLLKGKKDRWGKFWTIWISTAVITGVLLMFLVTSPDQLSLMLEGLKDFIKPIN